MTLLYRSHEWDGVYVPKILARGLTPVDWNGYLTQQRRWARSVLDLKLRVFPRLSDTLPLKTRVMSVLHGLNYLRNGILIPLLLLLLGVMLATGSAPDILTGTVVLPFALMIGSLQLSEWYRQRFYLDPKHEWGLHWRAAVLQFAKWPYLLSALWDVALNRRPPYVLTRKVKDHSPRWMMGPQVCVAGFLSAAWLTGAANGTSPDAALSLCALVLIAACLFLLLTERWVFPDPYTRDQEDIYARNVTPEHR
jgi:cellulose synthase/poly-beta-1,6-N-acetylglucosamine synthase-like glycosyltransferase